METNGGPSLSGQNILQKNCYRTKGKTKKHSATPARYRFNLVKVAQNDGGWFHLLLLIAPYAQPSKFQTGKHCFQVTLYSEDGEWAESWYQVTYTGYFTSESLNVEELDGAPWPD